jgi:tetratricopeptide (TPR) repeat protein
MHTYSATELRRIFGLSAAMVRCLEKAGHIDKTKSGNRIRYSLQDPLVLRIAGALSAARVPNSKINTALENLRTYLPGGERSGKPVVFEPRTERKHHTLAAQQHFQRALALEEQDPEAAQAAYSQSLDVDAHHVESRINLGRLLHLAGKHAAAEKVYRSGLISNAIVSFNLALLLEDLKRESEAILAYREALAHDPGLADAHFNLSRLHEIAGRPQEAFRHLLAFHRLTRDSAPRAHRGRARPTP